MAGTLEDQVIHEAVADLAQTQLAHRIEQEVVRHALKSAVAREFVRDPQRFPVIIETTNYNYDVSSELASGLGLRLNSQADVIVYTGDHPFWNALGKFWIRLMSLFSYVY